MTIKKLCVIVVCVQGAGYYSMGYYSLCLVEERNNYSLCLVEERNNYSMSIIV